MRRSLVCDLSSLENLKFEVRLTFLLTARDRSALLEGWILSEYTIVIDYSGACISRICVVVTFITCIDDNGGSERFLSFPQLSCCQDNAFLLSNLLPVPVSCLRWLTNARLPRECALKDTRAGPIQNMASLVTRKSLTLRISTVIMRSRWRLKQSYFLPFSVSCLQWCN